MGKTGCPCGECISDNEPGSIHKFVSFDLMARHRGRTPFFGLPHGSGDKADIWYCEYCNRLIFFDDNGIHRTRTMRLAEPGIVPLQDPSAKLGVLYDDDRFFDEVDDYLTEEVKAGRRPDYEFFDMEYAHPDDALPLAPEIVREEAFEHPVRSFRYWRWAVLASDYLALFSERPGEGSMPEKLWIRSDEDLDEEGPHTRNEIARAELLYWDVIGLEPGSPYGPSTDVYDLAASRIAKNVPADASPSETAKIIRAILSASFDTDVDLFDCESMAFGLLGEWSEKLGEEHIPITRVEVTRDVLRRKDVMGLNPCCPDGAPVDEYDFEAERITRMMPATAGVDAIAEVVAEVLSDSFGEEFTKRECEEIAVELREGWKNCKER